MNFAAQRQFSSFKKGGFRTAKAMMTDMAEKKRSTIVTIAEELGVSPSTVSRAFLHDSPISSEVRERILRCAAEQGYIPNRAASRLSMREITIGIAMSDCYMQGVNEMLRGIEDAFRSLYDYKLNVKVRLFHAERQSQSDIRRLLSALYDCDGIIVRGIASCEGLSELSAFSKLHRNVVLLQLKPANVPALFASVHDPAVSAEIAAEFLACCLRASAEKKVALFTGDRSVEIHSTAEKVFSAAAERLGLQLTASFDMQDNADLLAEQAKQLLSSSALDGIYITSGISIELCKAVSRMERRPALVTFDIYSELNQYIRNGIVTATIYQNLHSQAFHAFTLLVQYIVKNKLPPEIFSPIPELVLPCALPFYTPPVTKQGGTCPLDIQYAT